MGKIHLLYRFSGFRDPPQPLLSLNFPIHNTRTVPLFWTDPPLITMLDIICEHTREINLLKHLLDLSKEHLSPYCTSQFVNKSDSFGIQKNPDGGKRLFLVRRKFNLSELELSTNFNSWTVPKPKRNSKINFLKKIMFRSFWTKF